MSAMDNVTTSALLIAGLALGLGGAFFVGCSSDDDDAGGDASTATPEMVKRGEYLVKSVAGCGECHTPRDPKGQLDMTQWLAGVANRFDLVPGDDTTGGISAPNLTPFNLGRWSDAEIKSAMLDGVDEEGEALFPLMPYYVFHNMSADDANAIVAYLRTVPSISNTTPPRQTLPVPLDAPAKPVPESAIPHTTLKPTDKNFARAERGRYLAGQIGFCMDCHTPWRVGAEQPLDLQSLFAGGRTFSAREWVVPPPAPALIYSYNITPDKTGVEGWAPEVIAAALKFGTDDEGEILCRPMPSGAMGAFGGLTDGDAYDIGMFLSTLPPIVSNPVPECTATTAEDAGTDAADASAPDAPSDAGADAAIDASSNDASSDDATSDDASADDASDAASE